ncbi:MAG: hypothetical protein IT364_09570, partial [Candidatus Hydrogenedentes bacterium]|nr:hypothetical protein [Candidatus Hydrogenedentota bacterium]
MLHCKHCLRQRPSVLVRVAVILALGCAFFLQGSVAQEDEEAERVRDFLEVEHALSLDFVTPHTPWAKPYAQGPVKTLFFAPWFQGSTDAREIVELMQRFDLDAQAVYFMPGSRLVGDGRPDWYGGDPLAGTNRTLRLLDAGNEVLVFINLNPDVLPPDVKAKVVAKVRAGSGLVVVG